MEELRSEIRAAFEKEQAGYAPGSALRRNVVDAVTAQPHRESNFQWLAVAAAVLLGILVVAGLMSTRWAHRASVPAAPVASPSASPRETVLPAPTRITVAAADSLIRAAVTGAHPVLLPSAIPANWSAEVTNLSASSFTVTYTSPDGAQTVMLAIQVPNPPPPGAQGSQSSPMFHGDTHSMYQVDDKTLATSHRFLIWNEPGTWSEPNGLPGVPYFLTASGLTDAEFWAIANSVK